ncbi:MAG: DMT family transporter [Verrucomicrobia bacterium]|nr:DMT family transporter [Verrucomicrobiota bacterium]
MLVAIIQMVVACLLWGLTLAVPLFLDGFACTDIVLGRFFFYGLFALAISLFYLCVKKERHFLRYWKEAALTALIMNFANFGALTLGLRYTCGSLMTLIVGISPISIMLLSSWMKGERQGISLYFWPASFIFFGLVCVNIEALGTEARDIAFWDYVKGMCFGLMALATWSWYVVYNGKFMQKHSDVNASQWTALIGTMTLFFTIVAMSVLYGVFGSDYFYQFHWEHGLGRMFLAASVLLGVFSSWVAYALWNAASASISPALGGQLSILQTIFGLCFVCAIEQSVPSMLEFVGIALILVGVSSALLANQPSEV